MTSTDALVVTAPDQMQLQEREVPPPGPDEVQVEVAAVGLNFIDVYQRQGVYDVPRPFVMCSEGAGTVVGTGERVAWGQHLGSAAGVVNVPRAAVVPVPDGVELDVAAASMLQGMTAHYLVSSTYAVLPGDVALVHAAAGGVGQLLVQMITARGGEVIATAGTADKRAIATRLGARAVIDYTTSDDLAADVREANNGNGVHVVYDGVGKDTFDASLASLRPRGTMVLFGGSSGQVPPFDPQRLNKGGSLFLTRPTLAHYIATRDELLERAGDVLSAIASGELAVEIGGRYPLAEAARAYEDLEGRRSTGKLLLVP
ncbi:quinone oxidoreductase family protein [Luteipulveratus halotolerans]|uniref:NADPH--quinone reductase n=1 Tax=Luteipulveratus halotolerans TaxID=1631356 RepID=A0A0L6CFV7_9MICO|nr:quinone oxidoreductase [Luteipulveratus halotolerans]KNX36682.1 NADPH--quinone reductase [Luteipulveratus halotolerans]